MEARIIFANELGGVVGAIVSGQLHRAGLEVEPHSGLDEFLARPIVVCVECQLHQLDVGLNQAGVLQLA